MSNSNLIPKSGQIFGRNYRFEIEFRTEFNGIEQQVTYGYEFAWCLNEGVVPFIVSEYLWIGPREGEKKYTQLIKRKGLNALYKNSETSRCSSKIRVAPAELVVNKLQIRDEVFCIDLIRKLNNIKFCMANVLDAESFPGVIYRLQKSNPDRFELLKEAYRNLFPSIEDDCMEPVDFHMISNGARRTLQILTRIVLADIEGASLVAIEEPENSVHPALYQSYLQIVSQLSGDCKIIMTSLSPCIVNYLEPSWIRVGVSRHLGIAEFFAIKELGQKLLQQDVFSMKMGVGDYLFSMLADDESSWEEYLEYPDSSQFN